jgi:hypothetical protein
MNGFLHRLAQRANGTARLARSAAAPAAAWAPAVEPWTRQTNGHGPAGAGRVAEAHAPLHHLKQQRAPGALENSSLDTLPIGSQHHPVHARADEPGHGEAAPMPVVGRAQAPDAAQAPKPGDPVVAREATRHPTLSAAHPALRGLDEHAAPTRVQQPSRGNEQALTVAEASQHEAPPPRDALQGIAPLLARVAQPRRPDPPLAPEAGRHRAGASALVEETTEVHVSIGRIEVTALQEAPAPRKPARNNRAPLSLDDYLARRQGQQP